MCVCLCVYTHYYMYITIHRNINLYLGLDEYTPEFVSSIHSEATQSSIRISWSPPTTSNSCQPIYVDKYHIQYIIGSMLFSRETMETEFELNQLPPNTYVCFTVRAEYQGRFGLGVFIGHSTGELHYAP